MKEFRNDTAAKILAALASKPLTEEEQGIERMSGNYGFVPRIEQLSLLALSYANTLVRMISEEDNE